MVKQKNSRRHLTIAAILLIAAGLMYAFWPQPILVDIGAVTRGQIILTIDEEARTRVHEVYMVSAPVSGRLLRVEAEPGDAVEQGKTVVARMQPTSPPVLNIREQAQARTAVEAAQAAIQVAQANLKRAIADTNLAKPNIQRARRLLSKGTISQAEFERAQSEMEFAQAAYDNARAEISLRKAELANAQAALIGLEDAGEGSEQAVTIKAPVKGRILRVMQESEMTLSAGTPILEIGDIENDLEVIVELLSTDAVKAKHGNRVVIESWGGTEPLSGVVERIDPLGYTKFSALGVEEQRVNAIIRFTQSSIDRAKLGHGFRVEVRIVIWESEDAIIVPSGALFRKDGEWAVFSVENDRAKIKKLKVEHNNGTQASVIEGLKPGDQVILYPASELQEGAYVITR